MKKLINFVKEKVFASTGIKLSLEIILVEYLFLIMSLFFSALSFENLYLLKLLITSEKLSLNLRTPLLLDNDQEYNFLKSIKPEMVVVVAYGKILPGWLIELPKICSINIHYSLLPKYRGASPIQATLLNGDIETGITFMKISDECAVQR